MSIRNALVGRREVVNADGAGTVWYVLLADGFIIDCGYGHDAKERAELIAQKLNY